MLTFILDRKKKTENFYHIISEYANKLLNTFVPILLWMKQIFSKINKTIQKSTRTINEIKMIAQLI